RRAEVGADDAMYVGFDLLVHEAMSLLDHALYDRRFRLEELARQASLQLTRITSISDHSHLEQTFDAIRARGGLGLIAKRRDSMYEFGQRTGAWMKASGEHTTVLAVIRYVSMGPDGRNGPPDGFTFGVWTVGDDARLVNIGRADCNLEQTELAKLAARLREVRGKRFGPNYEIEPTIVCEIEFDAIRVSPRTDAGFTIRIARICCVRWDLAIGAAASITDIARHHRLRSRMRELGDAIDIPL
ncbi:MAG: hypothetical protein H7X80_03930, partial [bacterium]|nr:hypothetical protein [Candidatus Kapabacteria bacterium]